MTSRILPPDAYRLLFEHSMDAVLLTIPDGTIVAANRAACAMFGMSEAELCAAGRDGLIDTTDPRFPYYLEERARSGRARGELIYKRKDGSTFTGEASSVILDGGKRAFVIIRDVTALRESEEHARRIIDNTVSLVGVLTPDGTLIEANATALHAGGLRREEVVGKKFWDCFWWNYDARVAEQLREAVTKAAGGEVVRYDVVVRTAEDGRMPLDFMLAPACNSAGQITHLIPSALDITERKRVEQELREAKFAAEEASRAKSEFVANMSHELRTPMTVFLAAIEHLLHIDQNPERRQLLEMADQSAQRLRAHVDDILDFSRIEARKMEIEEREFDLRTCVREAVDFFSPAAREKKLRLEMDVAPDTPEKVIGDPDRLGQVLINLIGNAVKFTLEGEVRICVQPRGDFVEFAVADTGIGFPEEKRDLLFESFTQMDGSFTRKFGGTGLGLAISKGLVDLMGGEISVKSLEGKGSVFTFTVPGGKPKNTRLMDSPTA